MGYTAYMKQLETKWNQNPTAPSMSIPMIAMDGSLVVATHTPTDNKPYSIDHYTSETQFNNGAYAQTMGLISSRSFATSYEAELYVNEKFPQLANEPDEVSNIPACVRQLINVFAKRNIFYRMSIHYRGTEYTAVQGDLSNPVYWVPTSVHPVGVQILDNPTLFKLGYELFIDLDSEHIDTFTPPPPTTTTKLSKKKSPTPSPHITWLEK